MDILRGIAVCGILLVNIENFAMVREARYDPAAAGGAGPMNHLVWLGTYLFADTKFIAIFTMLFGAGIAVFDERRRARRARGAWRTYYRRMLFLLALGAAHGLYLWRGDILYFYAFWGLALYLAPRLPSLVLAVGGLWLYAMHVGDFSRQLLDMQPGYSWWEEQVFQGGWREQYLFRRQVESYYLLEVPFEFGTHVVGLMLLGMALYKTGFLAARARPGAYAVAAIVAVGLGSALVSVGTGLSTHFYTLVAARQFIWGSLLLSVGYIAAVCALTHWIGHTMPGRGMAALGRMALTNYLMQSVIGTTIFYGYGFGLYGRTTRVEQFGIVLAIWMFQFVGSLLWLQLFRFGPLEWVWRTFSYFRLQPMLRRRPAIESRPSALPVLE